MNPAEIIDKLKSMNHFDQMFADKFIRYIRCVNSEIKNIFFYSANQEDIVSDFLSPYNTTLTDFTARFIFRIAAEVPQNNLSTVIKSKTAVQTDLDQWFSRNHQTVGRAAVGSCLKGYMPAAFSAPEETASELYNTLTEQETLIGLCTYDDTDTKHQLLRLILGMMYNLDSNKCKALIEFWKTTVIYERVKNFNTYPWLDILKARMNPDSSVFADFKNCVQTAVQASVFVRTDEKSEVVDITPSGAPIVKRYLVDIYRQSETVYNWMKSAAFSNYYLSGKEPDYNEYSTNKRDAPPSPGCVLADTRILMADNTFKPITDIKPNDRIINADGSSSECSGEVVKNDHVHILYSINEDAPFMSLEHLILTASGYKCIDTETALELNPRLRISQLKIGDVVFKHDGQKRIPVVVEKINYKADNNALCADIHITDGLKSYITDNGYICYANYPEITADSIMKSASPLAEDFQFFLKENKTTLEQTFGRHAFSYISELASKGDGPIRMQSFQPDYAAIASMEHVNYKIYSDAPLGFESMSIIRGFAFFGEQKTPVPLHIEDGDVYWKTSDISGYLKVYHHGFMMKGHIVKGGETFDFTATTSVFYNLTYRAKDAKEDIDFGRYEMGYKQQEVDEEKIIAPVGKWYMAYQEEEGKTSYGIVAATDNLSAPIRLAVDKETHQLYATATFPTGIAKLQYDALMTSGCTNASISFTTLFDGITGTGSKIDDKEHEDVVLGEIKGSLAEEISQQHQELVSILGEHLLNGLSAETDWSGKELQMLQSMYTPTVEDLARLPVPDNMGEIHRQSFHRTLNMAVYAAYQKNDKAKDLLGMEKPIVDDIVGDLTKEQASIAENYHEFLIHKFISAYLSYIYIKRGKSPDCDADLKKMLQPLLDIDKSFERVRYFMNGNGTNCMPSQPEYSAVTNAVYHSVYKNNVIGLDYFYENNREDWAGRLYQRLNRTETLIGLVNMQAMQPDTAQLTHYYSMLDVLDSSKRIPLVQNSDNTEPEKYSYATVLRKQVINASFKSILNKIKLPDASDKEAVQTFENIISQFFLIYIKDISDGTFSQWNEATKKEAKEELEEMAKEYGCKNIEALTASITEIAADIVGELMAMSDPDISVRVFTFFKNHPKIAGAATMIFYSLGIAAIGLGFNVINQMTDLEKAEFAISVADIAIKGINDMSVFIALRVFKKGFGNLTEAENTILRGLSKGDFVEAMARGKTVPEVLTHLGVTGVTDASKASKFWLGFSRITANIAKGFMILTVAVSIGVTSYQLYQDIVSGEAPGILVLDSLMILADGVFLVTEAISCFASTVCAAIPIVGIVAAAVGIIVAFVSIFVKRKPPKTPIEIFVNDRLKAFVNGLEIPPASWLEKHPLKENDEDNVMLLLQPT